MTKSRLSQSPRSAERIIGASAIAESVGNTRGSPSTHPTFRERLHLRGVGFIVLPQTSHLRPPMSWGKGVQYHGGFDKRREHQAWVVDPPSLPQLTFLDFARLLQCASKFGDDLHMCANKEMVRVGIAVLPTLNVLDGESIYYRPRVLLDADAQWELAVTNSTKSAFCLFKLKPEFFCRYKALGVNNVAKRKGVKCQLLVKVRQCLTPRLLSFLRIADR
jgi:hypothetical protein